MVVSTWLQLRGCVHTDHLPAGRYTYRRMPAGHRICVKNYSVKYSSGNCFAMCSIRKAEVGIVDDGVVGGCFYFYIHARPVFD